MPTLKLNDEEAELLYNIVESFFENLRVEVMHTDRREYREILKQQEILVKKILEELEAGTMKVAA